MTLTPELQREIARLDTHRDQFPYRGAGLGGKTLMLLVGGIGFGKSTVIKEMQAMSGELNIQEGGTRTTRERKPSDPLQYVTATEGFTHQRAITTIRAQQAINWSFIPATGHVYLATDKSIDPDADLTLIPTMPSSVADIRRAGGTTHVAYIVPDAKDWEREFRDRRGDPAFRNRLVEARESINFAREKHDFTLLRLVNHFDNPGHHGNLRKLAKSLLDVYRWSTSQSRNDTSYTNLIIPENLRHGFDQQLLDMEILLDDMLADAPQVIH